jgi:hypothetical protein
VKLFFSGEIGAAKNIETMKKFRQCCESELEKIEKTIEYCKEAEAWNENAVYWGMTAAFGRGYYEMCIRWAIDVIMKMEELP